jgi:hypothetical protein
MSYGTIYKIEFPNGKHYIGLTTSSLKERKRTHKKCVKSDNTKVLYKALRKYNMVDTFELIEIDTADTLEELCEKEIRYIQEYNSYYLDGNGYNMTYGGEGVNGYVPTEEDNLKNSERKKEYYKNNPEAKQHMSEIMKEYYKNNPEARQQHGDAIQNYYKKNPDKLKERIEAQKKIFENPDVIEKCREAQKKRFENPDEIEKCSQSQKKRFEKPEERKRLIEACQKYHKDNPEAGKEHSERLKKYFEDNPEAIQKMSETRIKYFEDNPEARKKILDTKGKNKPFDVFTVDGIFIKTFNYQFEAMEYLQKEYNITSTMKISEVLNGKRRKTAGFVFKYK